MRDVTCILATCTKVRVSQVGWFTADHALLQKHWTLEHLLNNISDVRKIIKAYGGIDKSANFRRDGGVERISDSDDGRCVVSDER